MSLSVLDVMKGTSVGEWKYVGTYRLDQGSAWVVRPSESDPVDPLNLQEYRWWPTTDLETQSNGLPLL